MHASARRAHSEVEVNDWFAGLFRLVRVRTATSI